MIDFLPHTIIFLVDEPRLSTRLNSNFNLCSLRTLYILTPWIPAPWAGARPTPSGVSMAETATVRTNATAKIARNYNKRGFIFVPFNPVLDYLRSSFSKKVWIIWNVKHTQIIMISLFFISDQNRLVFRVTIEANLNKKLSVSFDLSTTRLHH